MENRLETSNHDAKGDMGGWTGIWLCSWEQGLED
jgi:hypothetical protein